jgi:pimeloyl-ACP methyl ester carboxylesterase
MGDRSVPARKVPPITLLHMKVKKPFIATLRWVGRILFVTLILFLGLISSMLIRESIARSKTRDKYPPPGILVSLNSHDIHLHCVGAGKPTVVFEADIDQLGSLSWDRIQSEVGKFTRACSYDRAGIMWSEPGPRPRDGETIANELSAVLDAAGEDGPFVLVGHALGGAYVRIFAGQNSDAVCGMVLIDSSHPDQLARFAEIGIEKEIPEKQIRPLILLLSHLGMPDRFKGPQYSMPRGVYDAQQAFLPKSSMAWFDESTEGPETLIQAGQYEYLDGIHLIVLASARPSSIFSQVEGRDLQDTWLELQQELTLLSKHSEIKMLEESGHYIQFDQPKVVIETIQAEVQRCLSIQKP